MKNGQGFGSGRGGMRKGRGMGRGLGRQGGGRPCGDRGRSQGIGRRSGAGKSRDDAGDAFRSSDTSAQGTILQSWKRMAEVLMNRLQSTRDSGGESGAARKDAMSRSMASPIPAPSTVSVARVDLERCTICGHCMDVCTEAAISMNDVINIDPERCIGCAACVAECPVEAISMTAMDR